MTCTKSIISETLIKKGQAARDSGCNMYLYCSPDIMDFRWNSAKLFGDNTVHNNDFESCPIETSVGDVGTTTPTDVDQMWKHAPASCDSTVTRETDLDGTGKRQQAILNSQKLFIFL